MDRVTWGSAKSIYVLEPGPASGPISLKTVEVLEDPWGWRRSSQEGSPVLERDFVASYQGEGNSTSSALLVYKVGMVPGVTFSWDILYSRAPLVCSWSQSQRWGPVAVFLVIGWRVLVKSYPEKCLQSQRQSFGKIVSALETVVGLFPSFPFIYSHLSY